MAALRSRGTASAAGSLEWIQQERQQVSQFYEQEQEDFVFSVRNETEWLNEHMGEILNSKQMNVTEIFKTPGKLRGKTPRTARQRSPERAPLTEIFSADKRYNQSPSRVQVPAKELKITSPKSFEEQFPTITKITRPPHDSVYHGSTEDQMEIDHVECNIQVGASEQKKQDEVQDKRVSGEDRTATEGSFHSARENLTTRDVIMIDVGRDTPILDDIPGSFPKDPLLPAVSVIQEGTIPTSVTSQDEINEEISNDIQESSRSSSVGSSPPKPLVRKSSLTFAALPAREPLGTKKSIGNQGSRISNSDGIKGPINRSSYLGRYTCGKSLGGAKPAENDDMEIDNDQEKEPETQMHNKDATQRLHDRINLLGKTQPSRTTKSVASQQLTYPDLSANSQEGYAIEKNSDKTVKMATDPSVGEEDDWILSTAVKGYTPERPTLSKSRSMDVMEQIIGKENISGIGLGLAPGETEISKQQSPLKYNPAHGYDSPRMYTKAASTVDLSTTTYQPPGPQNAISVSNPAFLPIVTTTTPAGSPSSSKFHIDGHLSASKHKLQSIMKSARGLFSSSAKVSNQAKIETMSPSKQKLRNPAVHSGLQDFSKIQTFTQSTYPNVYSESVRAESPSKVRKTRSSTEKERELKKQEREVKEREKQEADLTRARELERQKATKFQENPKVTLSIISLVSKSSLEETSKPIRISPRRLAALNKPLPPINSKVEVTATSATSQSQIAQPSNTLQPPRRPVRPAVKDNTLPKVKQPPVSIRIGPLLNRAPINGSSVPSSQEEPAPPVPAKPMVKPGSTISRQTNASTASLKSSLSSNTSKARIPITRKIERKPTAQEEAQKRIAERVAATEEAKKAAYRQALERKQMLGHNQPHVGGSSFNVKPSHLSKARLLQNGKTTSNQAQRGQGNLKTIPYANTTTESSRPPTAMSTKGKRHLDDTDEEGPRPIKPAPGQSYQQTDTKRRRTGESDIAEQPVIRPAMAAPIRNSNIRKDALKQSIFGGNYPMAPPPASMHAGSSRSIAQIQQPTLTQAARAPPVDMAKFADGRIPFANQPNPPQQALFKTPHHKQTNSMQTPTSTAFSPMFPNPENIHLIDIQTSDDDDDSEDERERKRRLPEWTYTPNMNTALMNQESIDPDAVFGVIAPANLDEWFPKDKQRLQKLRVRTSSAQWDGPDGLTEEEKRRDLVAKQKISKDGGWSMGLAKLTE